MRRQAFSDILTRVLQTKDYASSRFTELAAEKRARRLAHSRRRRGGDGGAAVDSDDEGTPDAPGDGAGQQQVEIRGKKWEVISRPNDGHVELQLVGRWVFRTFASIWHS